MALQKFSVNGVTYRQQYRSCGRKCGRCPKHGPYWYKEKWKEGKVVTEYLGKKLPDDVTPPSTRPAEPQPLKPMNKRQALAVLGIGFDWSYLKAQTRWQFLRKTYGKRGEKGRADVVEVDEAWALICEDLH